MLQWCWLLLEIAEAQATKAIQSLIPGEISYTNEVDRSIATDETESQFCSIARTRGVI
jgi:hypothetical protein